MIIKKVNTKDINDILEIENKSFLNPWTYKMFLFEIELNPNSDFWGVYIDDRIVGYLCIWKTIDYIDIVTIAVSDKHRKKGIASMLLDKAYEIGVDLEVEKMSLEVNVNNQQAINLYVKHEYKIIRVIKNYYDKPKEDAYLMQKEINYE